MKSLKLFCLFFLVFACEADEKRMIDVEGVNRTYLIHLPKGKEKETSLPLVLMLHGAGGTAKQADTHYGWDEKSDAEGFIVVYPEALPLDLTKPSNFRNNPNVWDDGSGRRKTVLQDIEFLKAVINEVSNTQKTDPKQVFMTGFSNGASMTFRAGVELSEMLAAIAPVSGRLFLENPHPKKLISALLIIGDQDPLNPLKGGPGQNLWTGKPTFKPPMIDSIKTWSRLIGADETPKEIKLNGVRETIYWSKSSPLEAIFVVAAHQGHVWPGSHPILPEKIVGPDESPLNATDFIWKFFKGDLQR